MYNGIGLQTPRGSGTNGYVQTNKFLVRARTSKVAVDGNKGFGADQGMAGISKKPNKEILEHDRKRQIELKLVILEDKLSDQGYTDSEIADKLEEARRNLEAAAAADDDDDDVSNNKVSDTQTHQIAARKEKQMEKLRTALGITGPDVDAEKLDRLDESGMDDGDDEKRRKIRKDDSDDDSEREEGEILHGDEDLKIKNHYEDEDVKNQAGKKKQDERSKKRDVESSDSEIDKKQISDSETDSEPEAKRKHKSSKIPRKSISDDSDDPSSDSDGSYRRHRKDSGRHTRAQKRHDSGSESDYDRSPDYRNSKSKHHLRKSRHDSEDEHDIVASKRRTVAGREEALAGSHKNKKTDIDRDTYGRKHEERYHKSSDREDLDDGSDSEDEHDIVASKRRAVAGREEALARSQKNKKTDVDRVAYGSKHEERYHKSSDMVDLDDGSDSDRDMKSEKRAPERSQRSKRYDTGSDHGEKRLQSYKKERHDSEDDDINNGEIPNEHSKDAADRPRYQKSKVEPKARGDNKELHSHGNRYVHQDTDNSRRHSRGEDEHKYRKHEKVEAEMQDGTRKRERRQEYDHDGKEDDEQGDRKRERREEDDQGDRRRKRREMDEQRGRHRARREEDEQGVRKQERGEEDDLGGKKRESGEEDDHRGKRREKGEENDQVGRKRERGEEDDYNGGRKRERREEEEHGNRNSERRGQEQRSRNERRERDEREHRKEEEDRGGRRHEKDKDSSRKPRSDDLPRRYETDRRDDDRRRR